MNEAYNKWGANLGFRNEGASLPDLPQPEPKKHGQNTNTHHQTQSQHLLGGPSLVMTWTTFGFHARGTFQPIAKVQNHNVLPLFWRMDVFATQFQISLHGCLVGPKNKRSQTWTKDGPPWFSVHDRPKWIWKWCFDPKMKTNNFAAPRLNNHVFCCKFSDVALDHGPCAYS